MKLFALLLVLVGPVSIFGADGPGENLTPQGFAEPSSQADFIHSDRQNNTARFGEWQYWGTPESGSLAGENVTCYKIRSYYVIREERHSDVTRPDGYSTCQLASHFAMKKAITTGIGPR